jgi:hypothetical protein
VRSPFPGMDPYLEHDAYWRSFHRTLMIYISDAIQPQLPSDLVARLHAREYRVRGPAWDRYGPVSKPDLESVRRGASRHGPVGDQSPGAAMHWIEANPLDGQEVRVTIVRLPDHRPVSRIELLTPANKQEGAARDAYLAGQTDSFNDRVNTVEIDLLRAGLHTVLVPPAALQGIEAFNYVASVYRHHDPLRHQVFTWTLRDRIPAIPIPLRPREPEPTIDLQALLDREYENGAWRKIVNYRVNPYTLAPEDHDWAEELLRGAGLRE